jgi:SAM-dependent methyltransferase
LITLPAYALLFRVTSDCKPWHRGGVLMACETCGTVQKRVDEGWAAESAAIYHAYSIYHQAEGAEQRVIVDGAMEPRSVRLVSRLARSAALPPEGRVLDVGCGNGAFLRAFGAAHPAWRLAAHEVDDKYRAQIEQLPGVDAMHVMPAPQVPGTFDLISLIHVLEHVPEPVTFLAALAGKLSPAGRMIVEVPNLSQNPFDLVIADHAFHFTAATLRLVLAKAGLEVEFIADDWVIKELTAVVHRADPRLLPAVPDMRVAALGLEWLTAVRSTADHAAHHCDGEFGLFGTSIAAVWLDRELENRSEFFVEEDPVRVGPFLDRPVRRPHDVSAGSCVYLGVGGTDLSASIGARLRGAHPAVRWLCPPPLPGRPAVSQVLRQ